MRGKAAGRSWLAAAALGVAAVLVLGPLAVGAIMADGDGNGDVAVVNMSNYPAINDEGLERHLDDARAADVSRLIIILPRTQASGEFDCVSAKSRKTCDFLKPIKEHTVTVPFGADPAAVLTRYTGATQVEAFGNRVTTVRHGKDFDWSPALKVGLLMTIITAGVLYFAAGAVRRRTTLRGREPVTSVPPQPVVQHVAQSVPVQSARAPQRRPAPRPDPPAPPGPLPPEVVRAIATGWRVRAQTRFGPQGGFVDAGGVLLWANLDRPGEQVHPGRPLSVLALSAGSDALVVSSRITEEVRQ